MITTIVAVFLALGGVAPAAPPSAEEVQQAEKQVRDRLKQLKGSGPRFGAIADEALQKALPKHLFFAADFPHRKVDRGPPAPLRSTNLFVVPPGAKPKLINSDKDLEAYLRASLPAVKGKDAAKDAGLAWLRLAQNLHHDGYFSFRIESKATTVSANKEGLRVEILSKVSAGGKGEVRVELTFDKEGKLLKVKVTRTLQPGVRLA